jgi:putative restriction endonuclease
MTRDKLLTRLAGLRQAQVGQILMPQKPLLLLWLFGQFAATGSSAASYQQAEEPVSQLMDDFGPPVASPAGARQRAAMPFVHLERELWDLQDATGKEIGPDAPERRAWLPEQGAVGRLRAPVERLLADPWRPCHHRGVADPRIQPGMWPGTKRAGPWTRSQASPC